MAMKPRVLAAVTRSLCSEATEPRTIPRPLHSLQSKNTAAVSQIRETVAPAPQQHAEMNNNCLRRTAAARVHDLLLHYCNITAMRVQPD
jgi:hypothetical protein